MFPILVFTFYLATMPFVLRCLVFLSLINLLSFPCFSPYPLCIISFKLSYFLNHLSHLFSSLFSYPYHSCLYSLLPLLLCPYFLSPLLPLLLCPYSLSPLLPLSPLLTFTTNPPAEISTSQKCCECHSAHRFCSSLLA